ncbi:MAG: hypothetical protein CM1200mP32_00610 [Methanobacteriota archaeon]|nr:MAG: hypothetical protein CM1200mP32_00610 [Euryarchaeota archaeon]
MVKGAVLVTGGARRIGRAICLRLAADGHPIVVHYRRSDDEAEGLVDTIRSSGGTALALQSDLSDAASAIPLSSGLGGNPP